MATPQPQTAPSTADTFDFGTSPDGWQEFCRRLGLEHLLNDPHFADWYRTMCLGAESQALRHEYESGFVGHSAEELMTLIRGLECCCWTVRCCAPGAVRRRGDQDRTTTHW
jgi:hypothetical protein